jgi:hypothetical protein
MLDEIEDARYLLDPQAPSLCNDGDTSQDRSLREEHRHSGRRSTVFVLTGIEIKRDNLDRPNEDTVSFIQILGLTYVDQGQRTPRNWYWHT